MDRKIWKFENEENARNFSARCIKAMRIFLGCDSKFWVVTMAHGEQLVADGYEEVTLV